MMLSAISWKAIALLAGVLIPFPKRQRLTVAPSALVADLDLEQLLRHGFPERREAQEDIHALFFS